MSDWFYIGVGAVSQATHGARTQNWNNEEGDLYLQMAGYNKLRQCELEEMARKNPSQFRELLGHERSPIGSKANPDFFTVDGKNYPAGLAKDVSEILAREGYKYLKNIDIPVISDAVRDPNYRKAMGLMLNNGSIPNSYLMSPGQERMWKYARSIIKREVYRIDAPKIYKWIHVGIIMGVAFALSFIFDQDVRFLSFFILSLMGLFAWGVSWVVAMCRENALSDLSRFRLTRLAITGGIMAYIFVVVGLPSWSDGFSGSGFLYAWGAIGIPFMLPLFILYFYLQNAKIKNEVDPERHKEVQQNKYRREYFKYTKADAAIKKVREEIKNNSSVLNGVAWCNNTEERRNDWDYTKDCSKGDFINRYRFERYKSSYDIQKENEATRAEVLAKQREKNIESLCSLKNETLKLIEEIIQRLEFLSRPEIHEQAIKIQSGIINETDNIDSKDDQSILGVIGYVKSKKAEVELIAKSL